MLSMRVTTRLIHDPKEGIEKGTELGLETFLTALEAQVVALTPVKKGMLKGKNTKERRGLRGRIFNNTIYAIYQEEGSKAANQGKGFFKPSVALLINKITTIFGRSIRSELRRS